MNIFLEPNFVFPEWRSPLNRGVPKEWFHRINMILSLNLLNEAEYGVEDIMCE